jgi:hypothetical protein
VVDAAGAVGAVGATTEGGMATALWTITRERQAVHSWLLTHQAYARQGSAYRNRRRVACVKAWCRIPWHHGDAADGSSQSWHSAHVKFSPSLNTTRPRPPDGCLPLRLAQRTCSCPRTLPTTCARTRSTPDSASLARRRCTCICNRFCIPISLPRIGSSTRR